MKVRKKPVVVDAVRWNGTKESLTKILDMVDFDDLPSDGVHVDTGIGHVPATGELEIPTLEGVMTASVGDWVIKGVKGEIYPCKPDIFDATYEIVETEVLA